MRLRLTDRHAGTAWSCTARRRLPSVIRGAPGWERPHLARVASKSVDPAGLLREQLASASPDLLRAMVKTFAEAPMSAEADAVCGARYGERSSERVNSRNGYRSWKWDTRADTVELAVPSSVRAATFRTGCCSTAAGPSRPWSASGPTAICSGVSTRRVEKLVEAIGVKQLSRSQVSEMATHLDGQVKAFQNRPVDGGHYTFVWMDALTVKVREHGRTVNVQALIAVGVNADGGPRSPGSRGRQRRGRRTRRNRCPRTGTLAALTCGTRACSWFGAGWAARRTGQAVISAGRPARPCHGSSPPRRGGSGPRLPAGARPRR